MSHHPILKFPQPVLRRISKKMTQFDRTLEELVQRLVEIMRLQPGGIGIAAPQIGVLKSVAIVDVSLKLKGSPLLVMINPEIIALRREIVLREGCMSIPDYTANVRRYDEIEAKWQDLSGKTVKHQAQGIEARCIQHEIDHLNGILFLDRVTSLRSDVFRRKRY